MREEDAYSLREDDEGEYDDDNNTYYYARPRPIESNLGDLTAPEPYAVLLDDWFRGMDRPADPAYAFQAGVYVIQDLWMLSNAAEHQWHGGQTSVQFWPAIAQGLEAVLDRHAQPTERPVKPQPQQQEGTLFDQGQYQRREPFVEASPDADLAARLLGYLRQISAVGAEWSEERTRGVRPTDENGRVVTSPEGVPWSEWMATWPQETYTQQRRMYDPGQIAGHLLDHPAAQPQMGLAGALARVAGVSGLAQRAYEQLRETGGFTLAPDGSEPRPAYYVADDHTRVAPVTSITPHHIENYMRGNESLVARQGLLYGGWVNGHGDVLLETSRAFDGLAEAAEFAQKRHEVSIYDGHSGREVLVRDLIPAE